METTTLSPSDRMRAAWGLDLNDPVLRSRAAAAPEPKQEVVNAIAAAVGATAPTLLAVDGNQAPKSLLVDVVRRLDLPINLGASAATIAEEIAYLGDQGWDGHCRSHCNVTIRGLIKVRDAIVAMHGATR